MAGGLSCLTGPFKVTKKVLEKIALAGVLQAINNWGWGAAHNKIPRINRKATEK